MIPRHTSCREKIDHISLGIRTSSEKGEGKKNTLHISILIIMRYYTLEL
jgi:hypothetical protein